MVSIIPFANTLKTLVLPDFVTFHHNLLLPREKQSFLLKYYAILGLFWAFSYLVSDPPPFPPLIPIALWFHNAMCISSQFDTSLSVLQFFFF